MFNNLFSFPELFHSVVRKIFFLLIIDFAFIKCTSDVKENTKTEISIPDYKTLDTIIPFSGYWLNENYAISIRENKSPKQAQLNVDECFIKIPGHTLQNTFMVYNFHEGGPVIT